MKKKSTQPESERARGDVPCAAAAVLYAKTSALQKKEEKKHALYPRQYIHHFIICLKQRENMCMFHQLVSRKLFFALL